MNAAGSPGALLPDSLLPATLILRGARLYGTDPAGPVDIEVVNGVIASIAAAGTLAGEQVIDVSGLAAMPGVVDAHTHPIHNESFASIGAVAAGGGVTTALHHLYPQPGESYPDAVARATYDAQRASADFGFHVRITPDRADEPLDVLAAQPGVVSVKSFLAHSDPAVMSTLGVLYTIMANATAAGLPVITHAEFGEVLNRHEAAIGGFTGLPSFQAARPDYLEAAAVHAVSAVAELLGARVYIAHVSNRRTLEAARAAVRRGVALTVESCPHYFFMDATADIGGLGRVTPPLRMPEQVAQMRTGFADGLVDVIASDHCGYGDHEKFTDDVTGSSNGLPGIELMLPLMLDAAATTDWVTPESVVRTLCSGPAATFGLKGKGRLEPGYDADIVFIDPAATWRVSGADLHDRSFYTPYEGRSLRGRVEQVYRRGSAVFSRGNDVHPDAGAAITRG
ncbi:MAG: dihydroorotase family protein [Gordonia sp. (in: high G+C Gram-positive bacteria)]